jgi:peptide/nickel transport system permease protein
MGQAASAKRGPAAGRPLLLLQMGGHRTSLWIGVGLIVVIALSGIFAPLITSQSPNALNFDAVLQGPSPAHPFGTDQFGRDMLARTLIAARLDLPLAFALVGTGFVLGNLIGVVAGWYGGLLDTAVARVIDIALAFPSLVLVLSIIGMRGPGIVSLYIAVSVISWVFYARLVRAEVKVARQADYIRAAIASDFSTVRILARHLAPNIVIQPLVYASSDCVYALLLGASVSFLGLGVQPPGIEWGQMVSAGVAYVGDQWWISTFPGMMIAIAGIGFSLIADGLADFIRTGQEA